MNGTVSTLQAHTRVAGEEGVGGLTPSEVTTALREVLGPTKVGRISGCEDGSAVIDVSPQQADLLASAALTPEARVQRFSLPAQLPTLAQRKKPAAPAPPAGPAGTSLTINSAAAPPAGAPVGAAPSSGGDERTSTAQERYDSL